LENVHEQSLVITMRFDSFADYWDAFLLGQGPAGVFVRSLTPDRVRALRSEAKSRVSPSAENLGFSLPARYGRCGAPSPRTFEACDERNWRFDQGCGL